MNSKNRDRQGRYDFDGHWDRLCVCGHKLGDHTAAVPRECLGGELHGDCSCMRFRQDPKHQERR